MSKERRHGAQYLYTALGWRCKPSPFSIQPGNNLPHPCTFTRCADFRREFAQREELRNQRWHGAPEDVDHGQQIHLELLNSVLGQSLENLHQQPLLNSHEARLARVRNTQPLELSHETRLARVRNTPQLELTPGTRLARVRNTPPLALSLETRLARVK